MSWARIDDIVLDHPKWVAILAHARAQIESRAESRQAAKDAALAWLGALIWGCKVNCDGIVPEAAASQIAPKVFLTEDEFLDAAPLLVKSGLWHVLPKRKGPGWEIHDFADYQKAKVQVDLEESREARKKALYRTKDGQAVLAKVRARDRDHCRYCWIEVKWEARRGGRRGTIDHVDPDGPNSEQNCIVACGSCNARKGDRSLAEAEMVLREPYFGDPTDDTPDQSISGRDLFANDSRPNRQGGSGRAGSGQVGRGTGRGRKAGTGAEHDSPPPHDDHTCTEGDDHP